MVVRADLRLQPVEKRATDMFDIVDCDDLFLACLIQPFRQSVQRINMSFDTDLNGVTVTGFPICSE